MGLRRRILAGLAFGAGAVGTVLALAWRGLWADVRWKGGRW